MIRWIRVVLPRSGYLALFLAIYVVLEGGVWLLFWTFDVRLYSPALERLFLLKLHFTRDFVLLLTATVYGLFRVWAFHPACRRSYREFLLSTPWTRDQPLPLGPVQLVMQDAIVIGVLFLLGSYLPFLPPSYLVVAACTSYLLALSATLAAARLWIFAYAVVVGVGLFLRLDDSLPLGLQWRCSCMACR